MAFAPVVCEACSELSSGAGGPDADDVGGGPGSCDLSWRETVPRDDGDDLEVKPLQLHQEERCLSPRTEVA
jgi:hypothetical protein